MTTYDLSPLTASEAEKREVKRRAKIKTAAQEKSVAYTRLITNKDFVLFLEQIALIGIDAPRSRPMTDYEQGRMSAYLDIVDELNSAAGTAKLIADMTAKRLRDAHTKKVFHTEQKGDE